MAQMTSQQVPQSLLPSINEHTRQLMNMCTAQASVPFPKDMTQTNIRPANERMRELQLLQTRNASLQAVSDAAVSKRIKQIKRLSLEIQALHNGTVSSTMMQRSAEDRELARLENEIRSRQGMMPSLFSGTPSLFGRSASYSPPVARSRSMLGNQDHRMKRPSETCDESNSVSSLDAKRAKITHLMTPSSEMRYGANSEIALADYMAHLRRNSMPQVSTPASTLPIRSESLPAASSFASPPFEGRCHDGLTSLGPSLGSRPAEMFRTDTYPSRLDNHEEDREQYKRFVLGYQLGLDAAARAGMSSSISDRHEPMAGASNSTGSDTRSEFRLSYSEIIDAYQMERKR
jgi:hypothetical protein